MNKEKAALILAALDQTVQQDHLTGWDPFDGLNSRLFRATPFNRYRLPRLMWTQLFKRSPVNFRGLTCTPKVKNAKALSLFARSYRLRGQPAAAETLLTEIMSMACAPEWGRAWGYPFAWQARAFYVPKDTPNLIVSAYVVRALAQSTQDHSAAICDVAEFIHTHLWHNGYIGYVPGTPAMVHNANLWGAWVLMYAHHLKGNPVYLDAAFKALDHSLKAQDDKGAWPYGEAPHHQFIDSFHTGYNLEALELMSQLQPSQKINRAIERGMTYYKNTFFSEGGTPEYYHDKMYPVDCHSAAQSIITLLGVAPNKQSRQLAGKVLRWTCTNLWLPEKGRFAYQHTRFLKNKINYTRWTQAWMHLALSTYLSD